MPLWSAAELRQATGGLVRRPFAATGVSIDTRTLRPGDLFVALRTDTGDGHRFVADALASGAAGALVHALPDAVDDDAPLLQVADTLDGLRGLAAFARARFAGRVVAVTGSVGKTTTKEMLRAALAAFGPAWAAEASHNNHWGVPLTLARLPARHAFCVAEIGMNHPGEIAPLARLARPDVAAITAIAAAHIGNMGSLEAIAREKFSISAGLSEGGLLVAPSALPNGLDPLAPHPLARFAVQAPHKGEGEDSLLPPPCGEGRGGGERITFGERPGDTVQLIETRSDAQRNAVRLRVGEAELALTLGAPGPHMAANAACALAVVVALGLDPARAAQALEGFTPVAGRGARRPIAAPGGEAILLDESYNASAASVRAALHVLRLQPAARRLAVLGDMLELGDFAPAEHAGLAPDVAASADLLFTCGPLMRGLYDAVPQKIRADHAENSASLAPVVSNAVRAGDAVLVKGSLGSRMKLVVQALEAGG